MKAAVGLNSACRFKLSISAIVGSGSRSAGRHRDRAVIGKPQGVAFNYRWRSFTSPKPSVVTVTAGHFSSVQTMLAVTTVVGN